MKKIIFLFIAILCLGATFAPESFGQNEEEVLAVGKTPLTRANVDRVIGLYEWALAVNFTSEERDTFQEYFVSAWIQKNKNVVSLLRMAEKILAMDDGRREELQPKFQAAFLADLNSANSETNRFLLGIYERARGDKTTVAKNAETESEDANNEEITENEKATTGKTDYQSTAGGVKLSDLAGRWSKTSVSTGGYRDVVTNDYKSAYGAANMHEIKPNGSFDYSNFATVSLYNCTTELFTTMKGRVSINASLVTFTYVSGTVNIKDSCKKSDTTKPAKIEQTRFRIERGKDGLRMCEVGKESYCLYKIKE